MPYLHFEVSEELKRQIRVISDLENEKIPDKLTKYLQEGVKKEVEQKYPGLKDEFKQIEIKN